jgi:hypothetical protein
MCENGRNLLKLCDFLGKYCHNVTCKEWNRGTVLYRQVYFSITMSKTINNILKKLYNASVLVTTYSWTSADAHHCKTCEGVNLKCGAYVSPAIVSRIEDDRRRW